MLVSCGRVTARYWMVPLIDISELDSAALLAGLYNRAAPIGYGFLSADPHDLMIEEAEEILQDQYAETNSAIIWDLRGRVIQSNFDPDAPDFTLYDKAHGAGAALSVTRALKSGETPPVSTVDWDAELVSLCESWPTLTEGNVTILGFGPEAKQAFSRLRMSLRKIEAGHSVYAWDADEEMFHGIFCARFGWVATVLDDEGLLRTARSWRANGRVDQEDGLKRLWDFDLIKPGKPQIMTSRLALDDTFGD